MSKRALRPCKKVGCRNLVSYPDRYCEEHQQLSIKKDNRVSSSKRGYDRTWRKYREGFLIENPVCVKCAEVGRVRKSTVVDHIIPHKGNMKLFWDRSNHQALCKQCHDRKTASEDGGFGNFFSI